jgi:hypothetical protein
MARYSNRKDAITHLKFNASSEAVLFLLEEQLKDAEAEVLGCNPADAGMRDKLVKAQTLRNLVERLRGELK